MPSVALFGVMDCTVVVEASFLLVDIPVKAIAPGEHLLVVAGAGTAVLVGNQLQARRCNFDLLIGALGLGRRLVGKPACE